MDAGNQAIRAQLRTIVDGLSKEVGANIVLERSQTVHIVESLDITKSVVLDAEFLG